MSNFNNECHNLDLINKFIENNLSKYNSKSDNIIIQQYPNSIFTKMINEYNNKGRKNNQNSNNYYEFYKKIYFPDFLLSNLNKKLEIKHFIQLNELCYQLNIYKKCKIELLSNSYNEKYITCANKPFYYYKFDFFGSYCFFDMSMSYQNTHNRNILYPFYIITDDILGGSYINHVSRFIYDKKIKHCCIINIKYITMYWRDIYKFSQLRYNKFKKEYLKLLYQYILPNYYSKKLKEYLVIQYPFKYKFKSEIYNDLNLIDENELRNLIDTQSNHNVNSIRNYNQPLIKVVKNKLGIDYNNQSINKYIVVERCNRINNEEDKRITFQFELLNFIN
jgi:hypothetical protein